VIKHTLPPIWNEVIKIVDRVEEALLGENAALIDATATVVTELVENAVKYGESQNSETDSDINFKFEANHDGITVIVSNAESHQKDLPISCNEGRG
jgi:two-component sensor histidine kinase